MSLSQKCALGRCAITKNLKACSACNKVFYCSKEHQVEHFKECGHKLVCEGKKSDKQNSFKDLAEKAQKYHTQQMWLASLPYYGAMLELTEKCDIFISI